MLLRNQYSRRLGNAARIGGTSVAPGPFGTHKSAQIVAHVSLLAWNVTPSEFRTARSWPLTFVNVSGGATHEVGVEPREIKLVC